MIDGPHTNWSGTVRFSAARRHAPSGVAEVQKIVSGADRVKAIGSSHSFSTAADTPGDHVSLAHLDERVELDGDAGRVRVPGGITYAQLADVLRPTGWALPAMASLPHIGIAGACATGTHGSGDTRRGLPDAVSEIELVTGEGDLVRLDRDDSRFPGAVVSVGTLGIVTALTLDLVPTYEIRQDVYEDLSWDALLQRLPEVTAAAYSVSVFTDWARPRRTRVWVKALAGDDTVDSAADLMAAMGARPATTPQHPLYGLDPVHCTEQLGVAGPWCDRLPHFRAEFTPSGGEEIQAEYLFPRRHGAAALAALEPVAADLAAALLVSEIRTIAADDQWLSPTYGHDCIALHLTLVRDTPRVLALLPRIEELLAPFDARPHWGKLFTMAPGTLASRYPHWDDAARLREEFDPRGRFRNEFTDRYLPRAA